MPPKTSQSVCIVRLSAIGDVTHVIPLIHALQQQQPTVSITWIIGSVEARLVGDLPGVEFIHFKKASGWRAYFELKNQLRGRHFDVVLGMQVSLRANLIIALLKADRKIGFDRARSKDFHQLVINEQIAPTPQQHVLDGLFQFAESLGIEKQLLNWKLPIPNEAYQFADANLPSIPVLAISPCSSHPLRNWKADRYAQVADYAVKKYQFNIVLLGGRSKQEESMGQQISALMEHECVNLIGKDTLKQLLAVLQRCNVLLTPDSGPAHMAACVDLPVIGLYAASNPLRSGPYKSIQWCVNSYPLAAEKYLRKPASKLKWGRKIEYPGVMDLITSQQVIKKLDEVAYTLGISEQTSNNK